MYNKTIKPAGVISADIKHHESVSMWFKSNSLQMNVESEIETHGIKQQFPNCGPILMNLYEL